MLRIQNRFHKGFPLYIGEDNPLRINVLVGLSNPKTSLDHLVRDAIYYQKTGVDSIQDVSIVRNVEKFKQELLGKLSIPLGTVAIYEYFSILSQYRNL